MLIPILLVCLLVGVLVDTTGIGSTLMPPALMLLGGVEAHQAMGTALTSFLPLALVGIYRYAVQTKVLSWPQALPLCAGRLEDRQYLDAEQQGDGDPPGIGQPPWFLADTPPCHPPHDE